MGKMPHTAMVFAAGLGTRLHPLTDSTPKPMLNVAGKPLIDYTLDHLAALGVAHVVVNTFHLAEQIEAHLATRKDLDITISRETVRLETGGGLAQARPLLGDDPIFLLNSDSIWLDEGTSALQRLADSWTDDMDELLLLQPKEASVGYTGHGDFSLTDAKLLQRSPSLAEYPFVFTGIEIFHPRLLDGTKVEPFSRARFWWNAAQPDGTLARTYGLVHQGQWINVDSPDALETANQTL